jgi:hypothetical protein
MAIKTAYKEKPTENIPAEELPVTISSDGLPVVEPAESPQPESNAAVEAEQAAAVADEAAQALRQQVEAHRQAETLQAQHQQAAMAQQHVPVTREEKLAAWDLSEAETKFLTDHPDMIDNDRILAAAIQTATRAGIDRSAPEFLPTVQKNFDQHLHRFQERARAESPAFFRPEPPPAMPARPSPASFTSAPVSREGLSGGDRPPSIPTKITLSMEEREAARIAGVSEVEYAVQKRRLMLEKASGSRQT